MKTMFWDVKRSKWVVAEKLEFENLVDLGVRVIRSTYREVDGQAFFHVGIDHGGPIAGREFESSLFHHPDDEEQATFTST